MKKLTKMMIATVVAGSVFATGMVLAQGQGLLRGKNQGQGQGRQHQMQTNNTNGMASMNLHRGQGHRNMQNQNGQMANSTGSMGPGRILRDEMRVAQIETLAQLSGQSIEQVTTDLKTMSMQSLLTQYNLDFNEVEGIMHSKVALMVKNAADEGKITEEQALQMYTQMSTGPHGNSQNVQQ